MALTQVSSAGIKNAEVKTEDILDANITTDKIADNAITGSKVSDNLDIPDSNKIRFGTGNDLEIYHDGSHSRMVNSTGELFINSSLTKINNAANNAAIAHFTQAGAVDLYHNGTKKLETISSGIKITSANAGTAGIQIEAPEGQDAYIQMQCDDGDDHPDFYRFNNKASDNTFSLENYGDSAWEKNIVANHGGSVELYYDNAKAFETAAAGVKVDGADPTIHITSTGSTNNSSFAGIKFAVAGGSAGDYSKAGIFSRREGGYNDLSLIFALDTVADATTVSIADEKLRLTSTGNLQSKSAVQSGGNTTAGFAFEGVDTSCVLGVQGKSAANGGAAGNAVFQGWFGSSNTFRVNCDGTIKTSKGIDFSGAQTNLTGMTSELLDSYEEGEFTARLGGGTNLATYYQEGSAEYTKIGRLVYVHGYFAGIDIDNSAAGQAMIHNLPFTPTVRSYGGHCTASVHVSNVDFDPGKRQTWTIGTTGIIGYQSADNGAHSDWDISDFTNSSTFVWFSATYITTT